jgi:hypothetical protein
MLSSRFRTPSFHRPAGLAALLCVALLSCTTGNQEDRRYATPSSLCGTNVPAALLDPVMPAGEKVAVQTVNTGVAGWTRCRVHVDGKQVLSVASEWWGRESPITSAVHAVEPGTDLGSDVSEDGSFLYGDRGGARKVTCVRPATRYRATRMQLVVIVHSSPPAPADEAAMKRLTAGYARAVGRSPECNSHAPAQG